MRCFVLLLLLLAGTAVQAQEFTVPVQPGWNVVGLQVQRVTSLDAPAAIAGMATWNGTSYSLESFTIDRLNAGEGGRRGLYVYAREASSFRYTGGEDGRGRYLDLRAGWNLASSAAASVLPVPPPAVDAATGQAITALQPGRAAWVFSAQPRRLELEPSLASLSVTPAQATVGRFQTVSLKALDGSTEVAATWTSSEPSVAAVVEPGLVKALNSGQAVITAAAGGKAATALITVTDVAAPPAPGPLPSANALAPYTVVQQNENLQSVAAGPSLFVAVGDKGTIRTSPDGSTWTVRNSGPITTGGRGGTTTGASTADLQAVTYGGGQFVVVGDNGTILTSPDGLTWTPRTSGTNFTLLAVTYGNGRFVAVGSNDAVCTSPDGITWTARSAGLSANLFCVAYGANLFVMAGGGAPGIYTSPDGVTWTLRQSLVWLPRAMIFAEGRFMAVGRTVDNGAVITSPDGLTWTTQLLGPAFDLLGVTATADGFTTVGASGKILTSPDRMTWTERPSGKLVSLNGVASRAGVTVTVGEEGTILSSADGLSWTDRTQGSPANLLKVISAGDQFVAVGRMKTILTSPDGFSWSSRANGLSLGDEVRGVAAGPSGLVAVTSGRVLTSPDGVAWTIRPLTVPSSLQGITYGGGLYVAVGDSGAVQTSPDGVAWTSHDPATGDRLLDVTFALGQFLAVGQNGAVVTSRDGVDWVSRGSVTSFSLSSVAFGANTFQAVGGLGWILGSPDGLRWTETSTGVPTTPLGVGFGSTGFLAVGQSGSALASATGASWISRFSGTGIRLNSTGFGQSRWVAVGDAGTIVVLAP